MPPCYFMENVVIAVDEHTRHGQPRISGTRITVPDILYHLADSGNVADLLISWPHLDEVRILDAVRWAAQKIEHDFSEKE